MIESKKNRGDKKRKNKKFEGNMNEKSECKL